MTTTPSAVVITAAGINCDHELAEAFASAGATPTYCHLNRLLADPALLEQFDLIGLPGGFSYGDDIAAGRVVAQLIRTGLYPALVAAVQRSVPIIAPCNGFQIAVGAGLLPGPAAGEPWPTEPPAPTMSLADNEGGRFIDCWVRVEAPADTRCVWTAGLDGSARTMTIPIAHGEGRFVAGDDANMAHLEQAGQIALRYASDDNPNGSAGDVAGLCDSSGLIFGLMPHPERFTRWTQHPFWTRLDGTETGVEPIGLQMFRNAVAFVRDGARAGGPVLQS